MTDYKKAVELADGWGINGGDEKWGYGPFQFDFQIYPPDRPHVGMQQWHKDALAAQLVRQVDVIWGVEFTQDKWKSEVHDFRTEGDVGYYAKRTPILHDEDTADRTDNTINAILESGVLEG